MQRGEPVLLLGGGSNLVVSDAGFPGLVILCAPRASRASADGWSSPPVKPWDELVSLCGDRRVWPGSSAWRESRGWSGPPRFRTSAPTARRSPTSSPGSSAYDRRAARLLELSPAECGFSYREQPLQDRARPLGGHGGRVRPASRAPAASRSATPSSRALDSTRSGSAS